MPELILSPALSSELRALYADMETSYDQVAAALGHTCTGCPDNCCDSFFLHYTYCEWACLWEGLRQLDAASLERVLGRARDYVRESRMILARSERPQLMCPLNDAGRCSLYPYRLMICRTHGVPAVLVLPNGKSQRFPGCFRCQELVVGRAEADIPAMDRTELYHRLARIEARFLGEQRRALPRIRLTIAEMIAGGPPAA
ncbi:MAG: hypothetical protein ACOX5Z_06265 [Desulfobulbus sp.]|jgi:hypothetical protein